jgi:AcrR family transcriptional regulator
MAINKEQITKKQDILKAAQDLFAENGFTGTSMSSIAKLAKTPKSLIYHHFTNKEKLWQETKLMLARVKFTNIETDNSQLIKPESLEKFIAYIVERRFMVYEDNPKLVKMMNWQRLEQSKETITTHGQFSPDEWYAGINHLQKLNLLDSKITAEMIVAFLRCSITGIFQDNYYKFTANKKTLQIYKKQLIKWLVNGLRFVQKQG